ncbi:MAG: hypothetical protein H6713_04840 [Myxococcales bacterium]|nr:hypothetical protein [Myxococcales bacterium]
MTTTFEVARRVVALGLLALSVSGGLLGCIATLAPNVRARDHHASLEPRSTWDDCSACHELESVMAHRLEHMSPRARAGAEAQAMRGGGAPLVRDWMAEEPRGCLDCHRLRGGAP